MDASLRWHDAETESPSMSGLFTFLLIVQTLIAASQELRARVWETHLPNPTASA